MSHQTPTVCVVTTAYNAGRYIGAAVDSMARQSGVSCEHVVVDDGSTDDTREVVQKSGPRVRLIAAGRIGRGPALNLGWRSSSAPYIAIQDADDVSHPERLQREVAFLEAHPGFGAVGTGQILVDGDAEPVWPVIGVATSGDVTRMLPFVNPLSHTSVVFRRSALVAVGGYDERRDVLFDWDIYVRLAAAGIRMAKLSTPLVAKRIHDEQFFEARRRWQYVSRMLEIQWRALPASGVPRAAALTFPVLAAYRWLPRGWRMRARRAAYEQRDRHE